MTTTDIGPRDVRLGTRYRVAILDSRRLIREGVALLLGDFPDVEVVGYDGPCHRRVERRRAQRDRGICLSVRIGHGDEL